jgi:hypothetical protein
MFPIDFKVTWSKVKVTGDHVEVTWSRVKVTGGHVVKTFTGALE